MIEHLKGRERALASLGWTGGEAEWIALVCLHSGVFTRPQFCRYFDADSKRAHRFVKAIIDRKEAVSRASGRLSTAAGSHAGYRASGSTGLWKLKTSGTGGKLLFPFSCGGFSRLILSWNIRG